jgi:signal transduction histidine kinase
MKLKHKFVLWSMVLLSLVLVVGLVSVSQLASTRQVAVAAAAEYDAMDRADAVAVQVNWLRDSLRGADGRAYRSADFLVPIRKEVLEVARDLKLAAGMDDGDRAAELELSQSAAEHLEEAARHASPASGDPSGTSPQAEAIAAAGELTQLRQVLLAVTKLMPSAARHHVSAAADRVSMRIRWTWIILLIALTISVAVHVRQYRMLVLPLLWLRDEMRRSAADNHSQPVRLRGEREFKDVATFFNGLARELAELYRGLEEKVIAKSRELVRSERLASVGFLAAGVAHEINNPLSVISGYAELATMRLRRLMLGETGPGEESINDEAEAESLAKTLEAQGIIRDEAFRCKEITSRLLSLARGGSEGRQSLYLDEMAQQVSVLTKGLRNYRDRKVVLEFGAADRLEVLVNPTEMKQVLLNLTVNALEAVLPDRGEVRIGGRRFGEWIELSVQDNGRGMSKDMLEHIFEPFFTAKRGAGEPGTGLGLSITHAIVENHGGRIHAESGGPGRGSRFTVRLPAKKIPAGAALAGVALMLIAFNFLPVFV